MQAIAIEQSNYCALGMIVNAVADRLSIIGDNRVSVAHTIMPKVPTIYLQVGQGRAGQARQGRHGRRSDV